MITVLMILNKFSNVIKYARILRTRVLIRHAHIYTVSCLLSPFDVCNFSNKI